MPTVSGRVLALIPAVFVAVVAAGILMFISDPVIGLSAAVVAGFVVWLLTVRRAPSRALSALNTRRLDEAQEPRLESLVESICATHGVAEPVLYITDSRAIDVAVVASRYETRLVVTSGALRQLDRLELEAVVARQLSLFGQGVQAATMLVTIAPLFGPFASRLRRRLLDDHRLARADLAGVAFTRYPPALASSFAKALAGTLIAPNAATDHLWLIGPEGAKSQPDLAVRLDTLREL